MIRFFISILFILLFSSSLLAQANIRTISQLHFKSCHTIESDSILRVEFDTDLSELDLENDSIKKTLKIINNLERKWFTSNRCNYNLAKLLKDTTNWKPYAALDNSDYAFNNKYHGLFLLQDHDTCYSLKMMNTHADIYNQLLLLYPYIPEIRWSKISYFLTTFDIELMKVEAKKYLLDLKQNRAKYYNYNLRNFKIDSLLFQHNTIEMIEINLYSNIYDEYWAWAPYGKELELKAQFKLQDLPLHCTELFILLQEIFPNNYLLNYFLYSSLRELKNWDKMVDLLYNWDDINYTNYSKLRSPGIFNIELKEDNEIINSLLKKK